MTYQEALAIYRSHGVTSENIASRSDVALAERIKARQALLDRDVSLGDIADFERYAFGGRAGRSSVAYSLGVYKHRREEA
jgi:hypothetical protein